MLEELIVKDFALSQSNTLNYGKGMTCITGETGAGKSLTVDALNLLLGGRADAGFVRTGQRKAEIEALFSIKSLPELKAYLRKNELEDEDGSLLLRRVIGSDGKSKAYVNGHPCTLAILKQIGPYLMAIHGQHAGIRLADSDNQLKLLDAFGDLDAPKAAVNSAFLQYSKLRSLLTKLSEEQKEGAKDYKNLRFELEKLQQLQLGAGDYERLSQEYDAMIHKSQAEDAVALAESVLDNDEHNIIDILNQRTEDLIKAEPYDQKGIAPVVKSLTLALEHLDKARNALFNLSLKADPQKTVELGEKLGKCHELARRFNVNPKELYTVKKSLEEKCERFLSLKEQIAKLTPEVKKLRDNYERLCSSLSNLRLEAAAKMSLEVTSQIKDLAMPDGVFKVVVTRDENCRPKASGRDDVGFWFSANIGEALKPLAEAASGGELSRLALAIEVLTSSTGGVQTLVFDEIDAGISGITASAVGLLLKRLGKKVQVITVTHLPQVASCADHQFAVSKYSENGTTFSVVKPLNEAERIDELARMMGGNVITKATLDSAKSLLRANS